MGDSRGRWHRAGCCPISAPVDRQNQAGIARNLCVDTLAAARHWYRHPGQPNFAALRAISREILRGGQADTGDDEDDDQAWRAPNASMEYLYGLLFGAAPKQSDADARHALHAKLDALPDRDNTNLTLTAAELRILKEATHTNTKHGGGDELFVRMHSNLTEDLDPSTADAVVDAYGASPLKPNPLAKRRPSPETPQLRKACKNAVADLISERQLASSVPKERRKTLEAALSEVNAWGFDVWSVVDAFQGCVEIKFRAPHAIDAMLTHWLISTQVPGRYVVG
jgi:hypothetical protein